MVTSHVIANADQNVLQLFDGNAPKPRLRRKAPVTANRQSIAAGLHEVIEGQRADLRLYSRKLGIPLWFVNEGLTDPNDVKYDGKVITMEELAEMLSCETSILEVAQRLITE